MRFNDFLITYRDKPLSELVAILEKRFEKKQYQADWIQQLREFSKESDDSLISSLERLKFIVANVYLNKTDDEKAFLETNIILGKLKDVVSKEMWRKIIDEKRKNDERGQEFNILDAIIVAEFIEKSSQEEYTPLLGIHNLKIASQKNHKNYEESFLLVY